MGLAPRMVTQVYQILAELKAAGHHHPPGGTERPRGGPEGG